MLTEKQLDKLTLLMMKEAFEKSPRAQEPQYQDLVAEYDKVCARLCNKLDDRRVEMLQQLLALRGQMEYEHNLHYLQRGIFQGVDLADRIEISGKPLIFS